MARDISSTSRVVILSISALAFTYADSPGAREAATYDYVAPQVAPPEASGLSMAQLAAILNRDRAQSALPRCLPVGDFTGMGRQRCGCPAASCRYPSRSD